jgi:hypothetical protein
MSLALANSECFAQRNGASGFPTSPECINTFASNNENSCFRCCNCQNGATRAATPPQNGDSPYVGHSETKPISTNVSPERSEDRKPLQVTAPSCRGYFLARSAVAVALRDRKTKGKQANSDIMLGAAQSAQKRWRRTGGAQLGSAMGRSSRLPVITIHGCTDFGLARTRVLPPVASPKSWSPSRDDETNYVIRLATTRVEIRIPWYLHE